MRNDRSSSSQRGGRSRSSAADFDHTAIAALTFIAADAGRTDHFLRTSGLAPDGLRDAAADPAFLSGIMDYLVADERLLMAFAAANGLDPEAIARLHQRRAHGA